MHGNSGEGIGVLQHVTRAHVYEPAFGRLFRMLSLTPSRVAGLAISTALFGCLLSRVDVREQTDLLVPLAMWAGIPAVMFVVNQGRIAYAAAVVTVVLTASVFADTPTRSVSLFFGLGGAAMLIIAAHRHVGKDHAFDNFDQFLSVTALALCLSTLGACLASVIAPPASMFVEVPFGVLGPIGLGLTISSVAIVGDLRRLIWLRRLSSGRLPGYAVSAKAESRESAELPALMGGAASDAVLVVHESLPGLPFRSGRRETLVARIPRDPARLVRRAGLRLFVVGVGASFQLMLGALALRAQ